MSKSLKMPKPNGAGGYTFTVEQLDDLFRACDKHPEVEASTISMQEGWLVTTKDGETLNPTGSDILTIAAAIMAGATLKEVARA